MPLEAMHKRFQKGTASKLALILKQKPDGSTKRRIVIDMRRSLGNSRAKVTERIILPRAIDIVDSLQVMRAREHELSGEMKRPTTQRQKWSSSSSIFRTAISEYTKMS